jgi:hypothetical protein
VTESAPLFGLLLDVDGPIASPLTRSIAIPSIATDLVFLANSGVPIVFNTGRSDAFIREQLVAPLLEAGLEPHARVHAVCEKGASWFTITPEGAGEVHVEESLAPPADYSAAVEQLVAERYAELMFFDHTKRAMVSVEQHVGVPSVEYLIAQPSFDADAMALLAERGFGVMRRDARYPDADGAIQFRCDPSIISTDIESIRVGKDFGAERAIRLLEGTGPAPVEWRTVGDSRGDYAMADWLHANGRIVAHVDVRPADGLLERGYPVLTAGDLIHDEAGAEFLARWAALVRGELVTEAA